MLLGDNAQGKSNLLEAIFLLATTRSERASTDADLIDWAALKDAQPVARVAAHIERADGPLDLEVVVAGRRSTSKTKAWTASKRLRVNGVPRRNIDMVGQLTAVLFTTDDLELISGPPSGRRRYLDVTLSQLDPQYFRARQQYEKVITQRNALLAAFSPAKRSRTSSTSGTRSWRKMARCSSTDARSRSMPLPITRALRTRSSAVAAKTWRLSTSRASMAGTRSACSRSTTISRTRSSMRIAPAARATSAPASRSAARIATT